MDELIFVVDSAPEGGFTARALGEINLYRGRRPARTS